MRRSFVIECLFQDTFAKQKIGCTITCFWTSFSSFVIYSWLHGCGFQKSVHFFHIHTAAEIIIYLSSLLVWKWDTENQSIMWHLHAQPLRKLSNSLPSPEYIYFSKDIPCFTNENNHRGLFLPKVLFWFQELSSNWAAEKDPAVNVNDGASFSNEFQLMRDRRRGEQQDMLRIGLCN